MILTQLVMFGCLECLCPDTVKLISINKYDWTFHLGGHRDRLVLCDQKVNAQFARR